MPLDEELRARLRVAGAFAGGALVIAIPLAIWHHAHAPKNNVYSALIADAGTDAGTPAALVQVADAGPPPVVTVGPARILECHDSGSARTAPADCDHPAAVEAAFANAITHAESCAHGEAGTIGFEADVSFLRKRNPIEVRAPHDERTLKSGQTARDCAIAVKHAWLESMQSDGGTAAAALASAQHAHGRYLMIITASYAAP